MKRSLLASCILFVVCVVRADGLPLNAGRYPGPVVVFTLTPEQKKVIDHYRTCQVERFKTMNVYTPYIFQLTAAQAEVLKAKKGFSPSVLEVFETHRGMNDAGPFWNLALRFSENEIEVPLDLVISDAEAKKQHEVQGWRTPNPCFPELRAP